MERNEVIFAPHKFMMGKPPKVSVFMPVYNAGEYLREAIQSILNQDFTDFEFVIVNDGSTDQSVLIIEEFKDPRIRLINNEVNKGLIASLNIGLEVCFGEYIVRMDQDDVSLPTRISKQIGFLEAHPEVGLIGSWFEDFGDAIESKIVRYSSDDSYIRIRHLYQTHISHPTAVIRASVVRENGIRFDPEFVHGEDYNCWVSISAHSALSNYPEVLVRKRDHPRNITNKYAQTMHDTCTRVKQRQFMAMGAPLTVAEADLYTRFADPEWSFTVMEMEQLSSMLNRIARANRNSRFIEPSAYEPYLAEKWFHLCLNNSKIGKQGLRWWKQIDFAPAYQPSVASKAKLWIRNAGIPV